MTVGFIMVKNKPGKEFWIYSRLLNEPEIKEVYPIFGEYDFRFFVTGTIDDEKSHGNVLLFPIDPEM